MSASSVGGILCILGLLQWTLKYFFHIDSREYPDGPRPLAFFGNAFTLRRLQSHTDRELMNIAQKWGDMCLLWAASYPVLIINTAQVAKELLLDVMRYPTISRLCRRIC